MVYFMEKIDDNRLMVEFVFYPRFLFGTLHHRLRTFSA